MPIVNGNVKGFRACGPLYVIKGPVVVLNV